ncbi:multidrug ABC transporter ATP-binding protein [Bifidobacterium asteroides]|uniref:ABC transporter ATP-binding protein n=1 Tax=Bifidobacterium TaxID=1678 RepID=UPI000D78832D|nr:MULTISPECIES: ABC transporter ATP-binding protein [Bifidobacterium]MBH9980493.1 ABC transporter ATP-binding protein [Bifidobacterium asteroides]MBI0099683.1 ABC transporter ATP-binding protein [Bifidobacterium sp. W8114]PXY88758.1 multidrug ABC transporter ATP-binding protein [Bifidobacterium asteroides]
MKQQEQRSAGTARRNTFREDEDLEEQIDFGDIKRIGAYLKPYLRQGVIILAAVLSMSAIAVAIPYMTKTMIDTVIPSKDPVRLFALGAVFLLAIVVYELLLRYRTVAITQVGQLMLKDMRRDLFTHIQTLPFSYFDSRPHGKILIRVVNYVNTLSDTLSSGLINVIADIFTFLLTLVVMFVIDWRLTLWSLVLMPLLVLYVLVLQRFQRRAFQRLSNKQSNLNAYIHESIAGVKTTQTFVREREQFQTFQEQQGQVRSAWMRAVHIQYLMWPGVQNISTITIALIYYLGITGLGGVQVTTGMLIAFVGYANNFWNPIINIGNFYNQLITCSAYLERIFETLDVHPEIEDRPGAIELPPIKGRVDFNDVVFKYEPGGRNILNLVDFHVPAGSTVALVGPTGAGKTTIVNLLSRFYDVTEGSVCVDGHDVRDVTLASLRRQMGVMLQDTFIFTGNVRENIRYGRLDATDQQIEEAAKAVHAHEFIMELPDGYDTKVEERGSTLSAGQRQLIAFARVLLADPRILILDEATSSIDTRTEEALQAGLAHLLKGRTSFVIAHRLSTIENADQIFYIDHGQIVEHGTHQELLDKRGAYYRLHESQYAMIRTANGD